MGLDSGKDHRLASFCFQALAGGALPMSSSNGNGLILKPAWGLSKCLDLLLSLSIFLATILIAGYFSTLGADARHDGTMFKPAMDVANGAMLFRDTFTGYGALAILIQAASLNIFGKYLIVIKFTTVFFYGLISILLWLILKRILPRSVAFVSLGVWIFLAPYYHYTFLPWSSVYALFFQLLGTWLLIESFERKSNKLVFFSGVSAALTFWCRQTVGAAMFLAVVVFFFYLFFLKQSNSKDLKKNLFYFLIGSALIHDLFFTWIVMNHAFSDWWKQNVLLQFVWSKDTFGIGTNHLLGCLFPGSHAFAPKLLIWAMLPYAAMCAFIRNFENKVISLLVFIGLASWLQYYPVPCIRHFYWGGTPMLGLFALFTYQVTQGLFNNHRRISQKFIEFFSICLFLIFFLPNVCWRINEGVLKIIAYRFVLDEPAALKHMIFTKDEAATYFSAYRQIEQYFNDNPKGNVINIGTDPLVLTFDPRIKNFHPMWCGSKICDKIYPDFSDQLARYSEKNKPFVITRESR